MERDLPRRVVRVEPADGRGRLLDGRGTGRPGGDFATSITGATLVRGTAAPPAGPLAIPRLTRVREA